MSLLLLLQSPGPGPFFVTTVRSGVLSVAPRITATIGLDPVGRPAAVPTLPHGYAPQSIQRITLSGVVDDDGLTQDSSNTGARVTITNYLTGASVLALTTMTYDSPGQWHYDAAAALWPAPVASIQTAPLLVSVGIYDNTLATLYRTLSVLLSPVWPSVMKFARLSANRFSLSNVADLGVLQTDANTSCKVTMVDSTDTTQINAAAMTYLGSNIWQYDGTQDKFPIGLSQVIAIGVYNAAGSTLRGTLYAAATDSG